MKSSPKIADHGLMAGLCIVVEKKIQVKEEKVHGHPLARYCIIYYMYQHEIGTSTRLCEAL